MNSRKPTWLLIVLQFLLEILADNVVKLSHGGQLRGTIMKTHAERPIYAFRGIPYAEPPVGELRFKAPVRKSSWSGEPLDASENGPDCVQNKNFSMNTVGQEDCLYLNVYTPKLADAVLNASKMAVLVWIHGGGFANGNGGMYGPGLLLDDDVVMVAMNYRLGPLGFLSTGDAASPGNYGLMDQSLALRWVKDNIDVFGGDVDKITIFGESAGGASVGYHLLSPMSKGLFHAAIAQSGNPFCSWAAQKDPIYHTKLLATNFNCLTPNTTDMVQCLQRIPAVDLIKMVPANTTSVLGTYGGFFPTVDGTFLLESPKKVITSGKASNVPYLSGLNKDEGLFFYTVSELYLAANVSTQISVIEKYLTYMLDGQERASEGTKLIMEKYFSQIDRNDMELVRRQAVKAFSDATFNMAQYEMVKLLVQNGFTVYAYSLDYEPSVTYINKYKGISEKWGVNHGDDLEFLFNGDEWTLKNSTADDKKIMQVFLSSWTNFAKYGNPTSNETEGDSAKWEPSGDKKMKIYHIDIPVTTTEYEPDKDDLYHFWMETIPSSISKNFTA